MIKEIQEAETELCSCGAKLCRGELVREEPTFEYYGTIKHCRCGFSAHTELTHYLCGTVLGQPCKKEEPTNE